MTGDRRPWTADRISENVVCYLQSLWSLQEKIIWVFIFDGLEGGIYLGFGAAFRGIGVWNFEVPFSHCIKGKNLLPRPVCESIIFLEKIIWNAGIME